MQVVTRAQVMRGVHAHARARTRTYTRARRGLVRACSQRESSLTSPCSQACKQDIVAAAAAGCSGRCEEETRHVCRQQINENKVARSSYSGAPAERSASIYTTQCSDLIWETDLHPRTRKAGREATKRRPVEGGTA